MQDFDDDTFPEDDKIEISDLDTPDKHAASLLYRICNAVARQYHRVKRIRKIHLSTRIRFILFSLALLIGGCVFIYLNIPSLRSKPASATYGMLQIISTPVTFTTNVSITNGIAYISTPDGTLSARKASDGTLLWQSKGSIPLAQPVMMNNTIYLASENSQGGHVDAFRDSDGTLQWSYQTQSFSSQSFMVADGMVYIHTQSGMLYALRASDGKVLWHSTVDLSLPLQTLLFTSNGVTAVRVNTYTVSLLNTQDGSQLWHYSVDNNVSWQPEIEGGIAYIYANENILQAHRLSDGKFLWQYTSTAGASWSFILQNGIFYVDTGKDSFQALDAQDGKQIWQFKTSDGIHEWYPENSVILFTSLNGSMEALSSQNGSLLWKFKPSSYSNIFWFSHIADGLLHVIVDAPTTAFYTLQASDGRIITQRPLNTFEESNLPDIIDNILYTQQYNGTIDAWRSRDGKHLWSYQSSNLVTWNLTGNNGLLYLQRVDGTLIVLRTRDGEMAWRYPAADS